MSVATAPLVDVVLLHPNDNVCVAARNLAAGDAIAVGGGTVRLAEPIKIGHKIAIRSIAEGAKVFKYGYPIGVATEPIGAGEHVHSHNIVPGKLAQDYAKSTEV